MSDYRSVSFWMEGIGIEPRAPLDGSTSADVAIVGGGYTGLWTAYYLKRLDPGLDVVVLEAETCGFGASGRNGGWCSALFAGSRAVTASRHGRDAAIALQREMVATVDEVGRVSSEEGIACDFHKGGTLVFATAPAQLARVRGSVEEERTWGFTEEDVRWLEVREARSRIALDGVLGAVYTPHCASLQPARLARGLATVAEGMGVRIYEGTRATALATRSVTTDRGTISAPIAVRATEGYTPGLKGARRTLIPIYSLMIATEPLSESAWSDLGWSGRETFTDGRHLIIYAQRTADGRIAMGGRGAPYHYGSRIRPSFDRDPGVFAELERSLTELLPAGLEVNVSHSWGGPLGVPRDWYSSVGLDRALGLAWAGGYVGDGVSTANLAGRTLADLILERESRITSLPWVNHRSKTWEPEPLRWIGVNLALAAMSSADKKETRSGKPARRADIVQRLIGH